MVEYLGKRGITPSLAVGARLGMVTDNPYPGHERFRGWLSIPYLRHDGEAVSVRFRCLAEGCQHNGHGKYMSVLGDPARVYGVQSIHAAGDVIHVTEGEIDRLTLLAVGYHAVAIPGASGWQNHHRRMLAGFSRVYVWGDGDDSGAKFINRVCQSLRSAVGVRVPREMDANKLYLTGGADALHTLIREEDRP